MTDRTNRTGAVNQYTMDGVFVARHESVSKAARAVGCTFASIRDVAVKKGKRSAKGYRWRYVEDDDLRQSGCPIYRDLSTEPVRQYTLYGHFVAEYEDILAAQDALSDKSLNLFFACKRKPGFEVAGGYLWRWTFDDEFHRG